MSIDDVEAVLKDGATAEHEKLFGPEAPNRVPRPAAEMIAETNMRGIIWGKASGKFFSVNFS
jgi:hypothetical protein